MHSGTFYLVTEREFEGINNPKANEIKAQLEPEIKTQLERNEEKSKCLIW